MGEGEREEGGKEEGWREREREMKDKEKRASTCSFGRVLRSTDHPGRMMENSPWMDRSTTVEPLRDTSSPAPPSPPVVILPPSMMRSSWDHND